MMNILSEIFKVARKNPKRKIIIDLPSGREFTYSDLVEEVERYAGFLVSSGIKEGGRIALLNANSPEFIFIFLAALRINAVCSPVRPGNGINEIKKILNHLEPSMVFVDGHYSAKAEVAEFLKKFNVVNLNHGSCLPGKKEHSKKLPPVKKLSNLPASINYTYNGTGIPLGVMAPHELYYHGAKCLWTGQRRWAGQRMLVILPIAHIFALIACVMVPLLKKACIVFADSLMPDSIFRIVEKYRIETITAVPEIFEMFTRFRNPGRDLSSLKLFISGGSVLSKESYCRIKEKFDLELLHGYGLTEFTPVSRNIEKKALAGSIGSVCPGVKVRIDAPDSSGTGEIQVKCSKMFLGYYKNDEAAKNAFTQDGWFKTGDSGYFKNGHLYFLKELKRTCKKNGSMVDMAELESTLKSFDFISNAEVSFEKGRIKASVTVKDGVPQPSPSDIKLRLRELISSWKIPDEIGVRPRFND